MRSAVGLRHWFREQTKRMLRGEFTARSFPHRLALGDDAGGKATRREVGAVIIEVVGGEQLLHLRSLPHTHTLVERDLCFMAQFDQDREALLLFG